MRCCRKLQNIQRPGIRDFQSCRTGQQFVVQLEVACGAFEALFSCWIPQIGKQAGAWFQWLCKLSLVENIFEQHKFWLFFLALYWATTFLRDYLTEVVSLFWAIIWWLKKVDLLCSFLVLFLSTQKTLRTLLVDWCDQGEGVTGLMRL